MKVRELIEALQKVDPEKIVVVLQDVNALEDSNDMVVGVIEVNNMTNPSDSACYLKYN